MNPFYYLFVYTFAAFGLCYVVGHAQISQRARELAGDAIVREHDANHYCTAAVMAWCLALIQCPACLGFWIGLLVGLFHNDAPSPIALGFYTAGVNFILGKLTKLID